MSFPKNWSLVALFAVILGAFAVSSVRAQVATIDAPGKIREPVNLLITLPNNQQTTMFTVPANRRFILTDIIISNRNATAARAQFIPKQLLVTVPGGSTFEHGFNTGLNFGPGDTLDGTNLDGTQDLEVFFTGYLLKA